LVLEAAGRVVQLVSSAPRGTVGGHIGHDSTFLGGWLISWCGEVTCLISLRSIARPDERQVRGPSVSGPGLSA